MTKNKTTATRKKTARSSAGGKTASAASKLVARIGVLLQKFEATAASAEHKISVADYIRLMQLKREFEEQQPKDITVTWVDSLKETNASEE